MQRKIGYVFMGFVLIVVFMTAFLVWYDYKRLSSINTYEECASSASGTILTYPDRCVTPSGQTLMR